MGDTFACGTSTPPTTNAVAAGTNAINATTRGCMVSGFRLSRVLALAALDLAAS